MSSASTSGRGRLWLWLIAGALALVGVAWTAVAILFPPARVRSMVQAQLTQALSRDVRFADASVGLLPPVRLTVKGPELAEPGGFARGAAFRAEAIHLDLDVLALLGRRVVVRRLVVTRPTLHLVMRADGTTNLDDIGRRDTGEAKPATGAPMDLELKELTIEQGRALVDDLKAEKRTTFAVDTRMSLRSERGGERIATSGATELSGLAFGPLSAARVTDLDQSLASLQWKLEHDGAFAAKQKRLALQRLSVAFGRAEVALTGIVDDPGPKARLDLRAKGSQLDLGELLGFVAAADAKAVSGIRGSGRVDFDLAIRGALGPDRHPDLTGALTVADGAFRYSGAPAGVEALALSARLAPDQVEIGRLSARVIGSDGKALAPITGSLSVSRFADPRVSFALKGPVNLAAVAPLIAPKDTKLGGTAVIDLRGQGQAKDPGTFGLEGRAELAQVSVEAPTLPKKVEKIQAEIQFSPSHAAVRRFIMHAGKSSVGLDATVARPLALMAEIGKTEPAEVDFDLRSPYLDLAELLPVTPGSPVLPNARGHGRVTIGRLKKDKLDVSQVNAQIALTPGVMQAGSYSFNGYGGAVNGSARFDVANPKSPGFKVKAKVDSVDADHLLSTWTGARGWLHGQLDSELDLAGAGGTPDEVKRTLTAIGKALMTEGTIGPGPALNAVASTLGIPAFKEIRLRDLKMPFRVEHGMFMTDNVTLEGKTGKWQAVGGVSFDGKLDYAVSVTLPPEIASQLQTKSAFAAGALSDPQGNLIVDLRVTGPAAAPKVRVDTQAIKDRLMGKASQALSDQRQKLEQQVQAGLEEKRKAAVDSLRKMSDQQRRALEDSLKRKAQDVLKGFFG
ncbi:MAG TPA: AsmA-like C-terminal region-containing protein, partial [Candidatus Eisenbacteria bacterium]|nr:AsmA-like C-terminal region-containing protein [Candidatus Eisenbacteria bacterium]